MSSLFKRIASIASASLMLTAPSLALSDEVKELAGKSGYIIEVTGPPELSGVAERPDKPGQFATVGDGYEDKQDIHKVLVWKRGKKDAGKLVGKPWAPDDGKQPRNRDREAIDIAFDEKGNELRLVLGEGGKKTPPTMSIRWKPKGGEHIHTTVKLDSSAYSAVREDTCGRGLEGMSLRWRGDRWQLAILWEGGDKGCGFKSPLLGVAEWTEGPAPNWSDIKFLPLDVPAAPTKGQSFRAPDLAWKPGSDDLIVLLASSGPAPDKAGKNAYCHTWLQVFGQDGTRRGDDPHHVRNWPGDDCVWKKRKQRPNWEALDTTHAGCLVMGHDSAKASTLVVFPSPFAAAPPKPGCAG